MACQETTRLETCSHEGCKEEGIACYIIFIGDDGEPDEFYCVDHAHEHGFCFICGWFWAGFEAFDFPQYHDVIPGTCPPCSEQTKYDAGELDGQYEDEGYVYDPYDFVLS